MPNEQDTRFRAVMETLTGPGGPMEIARDDLGRAFVPAFPGTLGGFFREFCGRYGEAVALVCDEERLSYRALDEASDTVAAALAGGHGVAKGDRVAIAMRNAPAWIVAFMAIAKAGGVATLINGWWTPDEIAGGLRLTEPALIIADAERARRIAELGWTGRVITLPIDEPLEAALAPLVADVAPAPLPEVAPDDDATILFTSGSTGAAKGAVASHRAVTTATYTFTALTLAILYTFHGGDRSSLRNEPATLVAVPLFHVTGEVAVFLNSIAIARRIVLMRRWDAGEALRLIEQERITYFVGVPTMSLELMQHPDRGRFDTSSLLDIVAGGAARPAAHVEPLKAAFPDGHPMMGYGLTETCAVGCTNCRQSYREKPGSTGRAQWPFVEAAVFGPDRAMLPAGEVGEIALKTAAAIRGYWGDPAALDAATLPSGHLLTGDLGYIDEDGYVFIVDRAKDIIIRGGENISCLEVEAALYAHPAVAEASVFGLPDERLGEVVGAVVHLRPSTSADAEALGGFLGARLARYKLPARIWFSDAPLPKLGTGKIDKVGLRATHAKPAEARERA